MKPIAFQSKLERISDELEYYAIPVPQKITQSLKTRGPVLVSAQVNGSTPFKVSLHPTGRGGHAMRVKAQVRKEVGIHEGDRARVRITVLDRAAEAANLPADLERALKTERVLDAFKTLPPGKRAYLLRLIEQAAKPETRRRRIEDAVEEAHRKREKLALTE